MGCFNFTTMKTLTLILLPFLAFGQVQIDKSLELTGSGLDARVMGIDTAVNGTDAVNLNMLRSAVAHYAVASGSGGVYNISLFGNYSPIEGSIVSFRANHTHTATENNTTLIINGVAYPIIFNLLSQTANALKVIDIGSVVTVVYNGSEFQFLF